MVEATEIAEKIHEHHHAHPSTDEAFRRRAAMMIGVIAMLLAITTLGGSAAMKTMLNSNIHASDTYAFYQAKNIRQTSLNLAADQLEVVLATQAATLSPEARADIQKRADRYKATAARYESEPETGDGKKELLAKAKGFEKQRDRAIEQDPNFEFAEALFQIAIVIGSVSIVAASRLLLFACGGLAVVASLLTFNGFFLVVHLPFPH